MYANNLEIVTTPTFAWLAERAVSCDTRIIIGCPYVNDAINELNKNISSDVTRTLITKTDLRDFAMGSSNLSSLCALARDGVAVHSLAGLHAKIYVFDSSSALVTSANATYGGMYRNQECGLATNDSRVVEELTQCLLSGLGASSPPERKGIRELEALYVPLRAIKVSIPKLTRPVSLQNSISTDNIGTSTIDATFSISSESELLSGFKGWLNLTLRGVLEMRESEFDIQELYDVCNPMAAAEYPNNRHVRQKLSEQLQKLRDLGLVEFVKKGHYRRTLN